MLQAAAIRTADSSSKLARAIQRRSTFRETETGVGQAGYQELVPPVFHRLANMVPKEPARPGVFFSSRVSDVSR